MPYLYTRAYFPLRPTVYQAEYDPAIRAPSTLPVNDENDNADRPWLMNLPTELIFRISDFLGQSSRFSFMRTCKRFYTDLHSYSYRIIKFAPHPSWIVGKAVPNVRQVRWESEGVEFRFPQHRLGDVYRGFYRLGRLLAFHRNYERNYGSEETPLRRTKHIVICEPLRDEHYLEYLLGLCPGVTTLDLYIGSFLLYKDSELGDISNNYTIKRMPDEAIDQNWRTGQPLFYWNLRGLQSNLAYHQITKLSLLQESWFDYNAFLQHSKVDQENIIRRFTNGISYPNNNTWFLCGGFELSLVFKSFPSIEELTIPSWFLGLLYDEVTGFANLVVWENVSIPETVNDWRFLRPQEFPFWEKLRKIKCISQWDQNLTSMPWHNGHYHYKWPRIQSHLTKKSALFLSMLSNLQEIDCSYSSWRPLEYTNGYTESRTNQQVSDLIFLWNIWKDLQWKIKYEKFDLNVVNYSEILSLMDQDSVFAFIRWLPTIGWSGFSEVNDFTDYAPPADNVLVPMNDPWVWPYPELVIMGILQYFVESMSIALGGEPPHNLPKICLDWSPFKRKWTHGNPNMKQLDVTVQSFLHEHIKTIGDIHIRTPKFLETTAWISGFGEKIKELYVDWIEEDTQVYYEPFTFPWLEFFQNYPRLEALHCLMFQWQYDHEEWQDHAHFLRALEQGQAELSLDEPYNLALETWKYIFLKMPSLNTLNLWGTVVNTDGDAEPLFTHNDRMPSYGKTLQRIKNVFLEELPPERRAQVKLEFDWLMPFHVEAVDEDSVRMWGFGHFPMSDEMWAMKRAPGFTDVETHDEVDMLVDTSSFFKTVWAQRTLRTIFAGQIADDIPEEVVGSMMEGYQKLKKCLEDMRFGAYTWVRG